MRRPIWAGACAGLFTFAAVAQVQASNGLDSPDIGVVQLGRGNAWLAKADDPLAVYFNPAALVMMPSGVHLGAHMMFRSQCFDRRDATGNRPSPGSSLKPAPDEVCGSALPIPNPQLAGSFRVHKQFAFGVAVLGPHALPSAEWPETLTYQNKYGVDAEHPAPQRYLMLHSDSLLLFPTLSASVAILPNLSLGAGFTLGIAKFESANMTESLNSTGGDHYQGDIKATASGWDAFIPGFVASVFWSPSDRFDLSGWFRWSDSIRSTVDLYLQAPYYKSSGSVNDQAVVSDHKDAGTMELPIPMEARVGVRYRHPLKGARSQGWLERKRGTVRDPMATEVFDIELNLTWAHNSAVENLELRFPNDVPVLGEQGTVGFVPANSDQPRNWKDVLGVRLGGDWVAIPDFLAIRAGAFFESRGVDPEYLSLDFHLSERVGWGGGATIRLGHFDISAAYQHTWFGTLDNGGDGAIHAISADRTTGERSVQAVNGGSASTSLNEFALGATYRF